jgi:Protein kinase domain
VSAPAARPSTEEIASGTTIGDHFLITRKLGAGGMGEVYLADNINLPGKRYAIKVLRGELTQIERYAQQLEGEAQRQGRLDHENIVQLYDYFRWQERYCLIFPFVDGTTLAGLIRAQPGGLKEEWALKLMRDVLKGLNYAHEHGVLHCDVKPANVLVDKEQRARVTDFGIARDVGGATSVLGRVVGTPEYMSPEQITDPEHVDHRADVFSAGVVLFEMLTGQLPFPAKAGIKFPQLNTDPADIRDLRKDLSPRLARIVATALQPDPAARFQGCGGFEQAIVRYWRGRRFRRTWLPAIAGVAVLALASAIGFRQWVEGRARAERIETERIAQEEKQKNVVRARQTIEASIVTAVEQLGSLCRESTRLQSRQKALTMAADGGLADLAAKFRAQVDDIKKNMADYSQGYTQALTQLGKFDAALVKELLDAHSQPDAESARLMDALRSDYSALSEQRPARSAEELLWTCARPG